MVERAKLKESNSLENLEEIYLQESTSDGYETGFKLGKEAGYEEGHKLGLEEGSKKGSELGFYRGFTMTWIHLIQESSSLLPKSNRTLNILKETLDLVEAFPKVNETFCEEQLTSIRSKFKQSTSLLNLKL